MFHEKLFCLTNRPDETSSMFLEKQFGLFAAGSFLNEPSRFSLQVVMNGKFYSISQFVGFVFSNRHVHKLREMELFHEKHFFQVSGCSSRCKTDYSGLLSYSIQAHHISSNRIIQNVS